MTFLEMQTELKSYLSNRANFTTPNAKDMLNRMYRHVSTSFRFRAREKLDVSQSTVIGTATIALPSGARDVIAIKITGVTEYILTKQDRVWYDQQDTSTGIRGIPEYFVVWGSSIYLYPTPSAVNTLRITYLDLPADMVNDGDIPDLPVEWHEVPLLLAASRACFLYGLESKGMNLKSEAVGLISSLTEDHARDQRGVIGQISVLRTRGSQRPTDYAEGI